MTASPQRADMPASSMEENGIPLSHELNAGSEPSFDAVSWEESRVEEQGAGGRMVLGSALTLLAAIWLGFTAWAAGRVLAGAPVSAPVVAQWTAVAAGPLALLGLVWLMFGRTRRKEAERFTRSVVAMRSEARALQDVLGALSTQIERNHNALGIMAGDLMGLGDETATRLKGVTDDLDAGSQRLAAHSSALDRAAESARVDIGVLLADLPRAEESAKQMTQSLRHAGTDALEQSARFQAQVEQLSARTREADATVGQAAERLVTHLTHIESAGAAATARVHETVETSRATVDNLLASAAEALAEIRSGIDQQSSAVTALVHQSEAAIGRAGVDASEALGSRLDSAGQSLDGLTARIAEQERASQRLVADMNQGLASLDQKFALLAEQGDERAARVTGMLARLRGELDALGADTGAHDQAILAIADRTSALREGISQLSQAVALELSGALHEAEAGASRLLATSSEAHPLVMAVQGAAIEAHDRLAASGIEVSNQKQRMTELLTAVHQGVDTAEARLADLGSAMSGASEEAVRLSRETGPALIDALVQVREAAAQAAERARSAITDIIPASAGQLGDATRKALEKAIRESVEERLAEVDRVAARAVDTAREASDRLTAQMLSIGQSAAALEAHIERSREAQRKDDGEDFTRRVSLLMDSMNSAAIDVQKILSDEVDEKAWSAYLKGNRGVFTRRAVKLMSGSETRSILTHYESDPEFQESVNRYIHDFEAMLRRVLAERDGGMIAVTLMSSDVGKLYAALGQAVDRRR